MKFKDNEIDIILRSLEAYKEHMQFISRANRLSNRVYVQTEDIEYEDYDLPETSDTTFPVNELIDKIKSRSGRYN